MRRHSIHVSLPSTWEEVPDDLKTYRRCEAGGVLQMSLRPPLGDESPDEQAVAEALESLLVRINLDFGEEIVASTSTTALGIAATSLRKSQERGLMQFWLIAGEITVFATYVMGSLQEVQQDLAEAQQIIAGLELVTPS
jgi:hypothetical protein